MAVKREAVTWHCRSQMLHTAKAYTVLWLGVVFDDVFQPHFSLLSVGSRDESQRLTAQQVD